MDDLPSDKSGTEWVYCCEFLDSSQTDTTSIIPISSVLSVLLLQVKFNYDKCQGAIQHVFILWERFVIVIAALANRLLCGLLKILFLLRKSLDEIDT